MPTSEDFLTVRHFVANSLGVPEESLTAESSPDSIAAWDSIRHVQILSAAEEIFGIEFTMEEMTAIETLNDLVEALSRKTSETGSRI